MTDDKEPDSPIVEMIEADVPLEVVVRMAHEMCRALSGCDTASAQTALLIAYTQVSGMAQHWYTDPKRMDRIQLVVQEIINTTRGIFERVDKLTPDQVELHSRIVDVKRVM